MRAFRPVADKADHSPLHHLHGGFEKEPPRMSTCVADDVVSPRRDPQRLIVDSSKTPRPLHSPIEACSLVL